MGATTLITQVLLKAFHTNTPSSHSYLDAFDNELMKEKLDEIVQGNQVEIPIYDFKTHSRYTCIL